MANEINGVPGNSIHNPINTHGTSNDAKVGNKDSDSNPAAQSGDTDSISLTSGAKQLAALEKRIDEIPEVDQKRVEAIKKAIESGEYEVNSESIARKLSRLESLLP